LHRAARCPPGRTQTPAMRAYGEEALMNEGKNKGALEFPIRKLNSLKHTQNIESYHKAAICLIFQKGVYSISDSQGNMIIAFAWIKTSPCALLCLPTKFFSDQQCAVAPPTSSHVGSDVHCTFLVGRGAPAKRGRHRGDEHPRMPPTIHRVFRFFRP
jgi:hypothetical protein